MKPTLFVIDEKEPEIKEVSLDLVNIPELDPPSFMLNTVEGFGVLDEVKLVSKGQRYDVVDGRRRLASLKAAGATVVRAKVFEKLRDFEKAMITLMSNYCRSHNIISELEAFQVLESKGMTLDDIQKYLNVTKHKVIQMNRLKDLPEVLYNALAQNKITESIAKSIAGMSKKNQKKLAKIFENTGTVTGADIRSLNKQTKETLAESMGEELFKVPDRIDMLVQEISAMDAGEQADFIG